MNQYRLIKNRRFDLNRAEYIYWYTLENRKSFLGFKFWVEEGYHTPVGKIVYRNNEIWAKKVAKHYGIDMPTNEVTYL